MSASQFPLLALRKIFSNSSLFRVRNSFAATQARLTSREASRGRKKFQEPTFQKRRSENIPAGAFGWERNSLAVGVSSFRRQTTRWKQNQLCRFAYTAPLENRYLDGRLVRLDRFGLRDHERRAHAAAVEVFGRLRRSEVCYIAGVHVLIDSRPK